MLRWQRKEGSRPRPRSPRGSRASLGLPASLTVLTVGLGLGPAGCAQTDDRATDLALVDSALVELGGVPSGLLNRTQRWRMISSIGPGLPPPGFEVADLPPTDTRAKALIQAHCTGCHWIAAPQMHSANEWPLLMRRMLMRAAVVGERLGGPLVAELMGSERMIEGMGTSFMPSPEDTQVILDYMIANALPVAEPGELGEGPETDFYLQSCARCHEAPSPGAHTMAEWEQVIARMLVYMPQLGWQPFTQDEVARVRAFLQPRAAPAQ